MTDPKPTPEAMRAARRIGVSLNQTDTWIHAAADCVDEETGLPALLAERDALRAALEGMVACAWNPHIVLLQTGRAICPLRMSEQECYICNCIDAARAALAQARGEKGVT